MEKKIKDLMKMLPQVEFIGSGEGYVNDVTADSRVVGKGSLFICLKGARVDGHKYLAQAVRDGAVAALVEDLPETVPEGLTLLKVPDTRAAMEIIAPWFFDYPGRSMRMIGVTGN
jgi:UDP-N-acetylmuramoyl-L-alanyl-D-glutamate--2,6-diaminopimelate ligase